MRELIERISKYIGVKKYNILIVDDVGDNIELLYNYIKKPDIKIYKYTNPLNCIDALKYIDLSLLILDIQMPGIDGYELVLNLKNGKYGELNMNKPIVFMTGIYSDNDSKIKGYNLGSIDYVIKPVDYKSFSDKIYYYLDMTDKKLVSERIDNMNKTIS